MKTSFAHFHGEPPGYGWYSNLTLSTVCYWIKWPYFSQMNENTINKSVNEPKEKNCNNFLNLLQQQRLFQSMKFEKNKFIVLRLSYTITIFTLFRPASIHIHTKFKGRNTIIIIISSVRFVTFFLSRNVWKSYMHTNGNWIDNNV